MIMAMKSSKRQLSVSFLTFRKALSVEAGVWFGTMQLNEETGMKLDIVQRIDPSQATFYD